MCLKLVGFAYKCTCERACISSTLVLVRCTAAQNLKSFFSRGSGCVMVYFCFKLED